MTKDNHNAQNISQNRTKVHSELLELKYLKKKTFFVNVLVFIIMIGALLTLHLFNFDFDTIFLYSLVFTFILFINIAFYAYGDHYNNLKLAMYITILGLYAITASLIIDIRSPSAFTILFLVYAVSYLYQDIKASFLNNLLLFAIGSMIILFYPNVYAMVGAPSPSTAYMLIFLIIFVVLLFISSFVLIKRKVYFYHQVSKIKEQELKVISILFELQEKYTNQKIDVQSYYDSYDSFFEALSNKIGIDNIFKEKINILRDMTKLQDKDLLKKYPKYQLSDLNEMKQLELSVHKKMLYLAFKASQSNEVNFNKKDLFSQTQFKSLNHYNDDHFVKVIVFASFYTLLKRDKPYLELLKDDEIVDLLKKSELEHIIDRKILTIYLENQEVFNKIIEDAFYKKVK